MMFVRMSIISLVIGVISFSCLFVYAIDPVIIEPPVSAEESEGLSGLELTTLFESRSKNIGYVKYAIFLAEFPGYKLKAAILFLGIFLVSFLSQWIFLEGIKSRIK